MTTAAPQWTGSWVERRLGVHVQEAGGPQGIGVRDLVGLALRRNPRRAHLLVSTVLGKHVPVRPAVAQAAGRALGTAVAERLTGTPSAVDPAALRAGLLGTAPLPALPDVPVPVAVVVGYAETATALGHLVADVLDATYLHSTRRPTPGLADAAGFEEAHSHATSHLLTPRDPGLLERPGPVVLVDDELSTGATALATIRALQRLRPRERYVIAALVDVRTEADRAAVGDAARALGCRIDVVALATGRLVLPVDVLAAGTALVERLGAPAWSGPPAGDAVRLRLPPVIEGARTGFTPADRAAWRSAVPAAAAAIAPLLPAAGRVHVLGTEELMAHPLAVAAELERLLPAVAVTFSSTTRSPVVAVDDPGSAVRTAAVFPAYDDPADGPGDRFAYNVRPGLADAVVVLVDEAGDTPLLDGLVDVLRAAAPSVVVAVLPAEAGA